MLLSLLAATLALAFAPTRYATMETTFATGFYEPSRSATLAVSYNEDGSPQRITLAVSGRKFTADVWRTYNSRCGNRIDARLSVPNYRVSTNLDLLDYFSVRCRIYAKHKWRARVNTWEADGSESRLELEGDPRD